MKRIAVFTLVLLVSLALIAGCASNKSASSAAGARSSWHTHGGMIVLVVDGIGYYQEEGNKAQVLRRGDKVVICTPVWWYKMPFERK